MSEARPCLWFDADHVAYLAHLRDQQQPHLCAVLAIAAAEVRRSEEDLFVEQAPDGGRPQVRDGDRFLAANALLALLDKDSARRQQWAAQGLAFFRRVSGPDYSSDLGVGALSLAGSILIDSCLPLLPALDADWLLAKVDELHQRTRHLVTSGNPHTVNNNWWAITHGGCLLAGLALNGQRASDGKVYDCSEGIHWARQRLHAFCHHFGDAGLYHEGLGYQGYTMSMLYPALLADQHHGGPNVHQLFPHLAHSAASLYASVVACPPTADVLASDDGCAAAAPSLGMQLSWNDAGPNHAGGIQEPAMIALAAEGQQGALRWFYDRLHGVDGDGQFSPTYSGLYFSAVLYPYAAAVEEPEGRLPTFVADNRQGMVIARSGYQGADDAVLGVYARATHVGGHSADDAGSIRLIALGHDWIVGGGQARGAAAYQSVVIDDSGERPKPTPCGSLFWREPTDHGAIVAMDLRKVLVAYAERHVAVDYSGASGVPVALALLDQIDDHRSDRGWLWNLSFAPNLNAEIDADGQGFRLLADDGCQLQARFLAALPQAITLEQMPASKRTYANGNTVAYRPRHYVQARFAGCTPLGIYTAITVSRGPGPSLTAGAGVGLQIGDYQWRRPFGVSLPVDFQPGVSGGVCPFPDGVRPGK